MYVDRPPVNQRPFSFRQRYCTLRNCFFCICGLCTLLIASTIISLIIVYFVRYGNSMVSLLSYPNFICGSRPCGCPNYNSRKPFLARIIGGNDAAPYTYPWLVALTDRYAREPFCSGFIISSNAILTAAHCLNGRTPNQIQILARIHDLRYFTGDVHDIDRWFIHPEYRHNDTTHLNDIALIKIRNTFAYDLQPCCLPTTLTSIYPQEKTTAIASGWGKFAAKPNALTSPILQHVALPIVNERNTRCRQSVIDINRQLCAGYDSLSVDTCSGDSGGPLLTVEYNERNEGNFVASGLVSYGNRQCDSSISSGVYTRVGFYLPWIRDILSNL